MEYKESNLILLVYSRETANSEWILTNWEIDPYLLKLLGPDIAIRPEKSDPAITNPTHIHTQIIQERIKKLTEKNGDDSLPIQIRSASGSSGVLECTVELRFERRKNKRPGHNIDPGQPQ